MKECVCCVDIGTSTIKAALIDDCGRIIHLHTSPSIAEGDNDLAFHPDRLLTNIAQTVRKVLGETDVSKVQALAMTNQRATVLSYDLQTRRCGRAVSWQDTRCAPFVDQFFSQYSPVSFQRLTGLPPSALWSLAKILQIKSEKSSRNRKSKFILLQDYFLNRLGADDFYCDYSNASLTGLLDISKLEYSGEILNVAGISIDELPVLRQCGQEIGHLNRWGARHFGLLEGTPLILGGGDQQCAALGAGAVYPGLAVLCLGTAAVLSIPSSFPLVESNSGFFCTVHAEKGRWVIEGIQNSFGSSMLWIKDVLGLSVKKMREDIYSGRFMHPGDIFYFPFLSGIGSPDYRSDARAAFLGIAQAHDRKDLALAVLQGVCLEFRRIMEAVSKKIELKDIVVAGGRSQIPLLVQTLADVLGRPIRVYRISEVSLLGTSLLAWTGIKRYSNVSSAHRAFSEKSYLWRDIRPSGPDWEEKYSRYKKFVEVVVSEFKR